MALPSPPSLAMAATESKEAQETKDAKDAKQSKSQGHPKVPDLSKALSPYALNALAKALIKTFRMLSLYFSTARRGAVVKVVWFSLTYFD